jgi:hypothetical protein
LPVEFARQSKSSRIALVITEGADPITVLWAALDAGSLDEARKLLALRETDAPASSFPGESYVVPIDDLAIILNPKTEQAEKRG